MIRLFILSILIISSTSASAKTFKNSFIRFELPNNWECKITGAAWNCSDKFEKKEKSAVIVFAAKKAGAQDKLEAYIKQISNKPGVTIAGKKHFKIKKIKIQKTSINGQKWVDGLSFNSEAPDFYTRYLATVKNKTAVIITFTAHKNYYTTIVSDFINAINSLEILNPEDSKITATKVTKFKKQADQKVLDPIDISDDILEEEEDTPSLLTPQNFFIAIFSILILLVLLKK